MKIVITDYMERSPKGRASKPRKTTYQNLSDNRDVAVEEAYTAHEAAIARGDLPAPYKTAGYSL